MAIRLLINNLLLYIIIIIHLCNLIILPFSHNNNKNETVEAHYYVAR